MVLKFPQVKYQVTAREVLELSMSVPQSKTKKQKAKSKNRKLKIKNRKSKFKN
jgi:hypothetical protein